ncbi:hypothetical protein ABBQ38_014891 [Trebouxia sp. C0009 RCD-2024]
MLARAQVSSSTQARFGTTDDHLAILLRPAAQSCFGFKARNQKVCFKRCRSITKATSEPQETSAQLFSRRQALLLGAGSLAASNTASPSSATAETSEVAAVGIKSTETVQLGQSGLQISPVGVGAWSWGDRTGYWGYGNEYQKEDNLDAYKAVVGNGISFIDTSEVYGLGLSEEFLQDFMKQTGTQPVIATKFAPLPWRFREQNVVEACKKSLQRLGISKLGLYMIHWPGFITNGWCNDAFVKGLADCQQQGLTQAVGVSNFKLERVKTAQQILKDRGTSLASNQVQYSLLYRAPETNGVKQACEEGGTTLIAYSPLAQGLLTGKFTENNLPKGPRGTTINKERVAQVQPLLGLMRDIGSAHGGRTPGQVAINWTICKGAVPIPGAKNARQAKEAAGAFGWRLSKDEMAALDKESSKLPSALGAPFENW